MAMTLASMLFGALLGGIASYLFLSRRIARAERELRRMRRELAETERCGEELEEFRERQRTRKEAAKGKILAALQRKGTLQNEEIADIAGVSAATVVRYMDELEREGKAIQQGRTGRGVRYAANASAGG